MIKIDHITVFNEGMYHHLFCETGKGTFNCHIHPSLAMRIQSFFNSSINSVSTILQQIISLDFADKKCFLIQENQEIVAKLILGNKIYQSSLEEILPLAMELNADLYLASHLCTQDYVFNQAHEDEVMDLYLEEKNFFEQQKIKRLQDDIKHAVSYEQYEYAAFLRDKIQLLQEN